MRLLPRSCRSHHPTSYELATDGLTGFGDLPDGAPIVTNPHVLCETSGYLHQRRTVQLILWRGGPFVMQHGEDIPFSERPLVRFLSLRYALQPRPFLVAGVVVNLVLTSLLLVLSSYAPQNAPAFWALACLIVWINVCLTSARLLDAQAYRGLALFVAFPVGIATWYADRLGLPAPVVIGASAIGFVLANLFALFAPTSDPGAREAREQRIAIERRQLDLDP